jgi:endonuclease/exonuclease/phosphatase family metal-dependent hydrolase
MDDLGDVPIIYMGDMNSESPDDTSDNGPDDLGTEAINMVLDRNDPHASEVHSFTDVHIAVGSGAGNSYIQEPYISRIDYIFVNQYFDDLIQKSTTGDTDSAELASDHVPVDVTIDLSSFGIEPFTLPDFSSSDSPDNPLPIPLMAIIFATMIPVISRKMKRKI